MHTSFKTCTCCRHRWITRQGFLSDPQVEIVGYQVNFEDLQLGFFLFNHLACKSTIAVTAKYFLDLYRGPVFERRLAGSGDCLRHCLQKYDLDPCERSCECAYVRQVLQVLRRWPKQDPAAPSVGEAAGG